MALVGQRAAAGRDAALRYRPATRAVGTVYLVEGEDGTEFAMKRCRVQDKFEEGHVGECVVGNSREVQMLGALSADPDNHHVPRLVDHFYSFDALSSRSHVRTSNNVVLELFGRSLDKHVPLIQVRRPREPSRSGRSRHDPRAPRRATWRLRASWRARCLPVRT